jgi:hypothetical protein
VHVRLIFFVFIKIYSCSGSFFWRYPLLLKKKKQRSGFAIQSFAQEKWAKGFPFQSLTDWQFSLHTGFFAR